MRIRYIIQSALSALRAHKTRSVLTVLGIVIGIASIILIMALGQGAEKVIVGELSGLGAETIVVRPGQEPEGPSDFTDVLFSDSLKDRELEALSRKSNVPSIDTLAPEVLVSGSVSYQGETFSGTVFGWSADMMAETLKIYPAQGSIFTDTDIRRRANVAIIGQEVKEELFGLSDAVGESIRIRGKNFRVIGVYPPRGQVVFFNVDELVLLPYTTAQDIMGIQHYNQIIVRAENTEVVDETVRDITLTLRELHTITDPAKDDFSVSTQQGLVEQIQTILGVLTLFLALVVAIALVVGGIGVMNIMLVSVTERTREIGLRKALGATPKDIQKQFLLEAVMLTASGGVIGIVLGAALSALAAFAVRAFSGFAIGFSFPLGAALIGLAVSSVVGLVFGIYPARQAAQKNPIEALRYE